MLDKNKSVLLSFDQAKDAMAALIAELDLKSKPAVYRIELRINPIDSIDWLEAQTAQVKIYGANQDNVAIIAGVGTALTVEGATSVAAKDVFDQLRASLSPQYPYLQWYGGFCFDCAKEDESWEDFGAYRFVMPRFELASLGDKMIFCCNLMGSITETQRKVVLKELKDLNKNSKGLKAGKALSRRDIPSQKQWESHVNAVLKGIDEHKFQKVVLARKTILNFEHTPNAFSIFKELYKVTPNSYHFLFQFGSTTFLGASPERLYKRQGRAIVSEAIAGTSPRGQDHASDLQNQNQLLASIKDNHEHTFVVDFIEASLKPLCLELTKCDHPAVIHLTNGHHLITPFSGQLKENVKDEDILQAMHPTPAVGGTPRKEALKAIFQLEEFSRGWYAAPLGYVGLDWVEFVVGIRSGLIKNKTLSIFAGAGIVKGSNPHAEWHEIENKISNFIRVIK